MDAAVDGWATIRLDRIDPMTGGKLAGSPLGSLRNMLTTGDRFVAAMTRLRMQRAIFDENVALIRPFTLIVHGNAESKSR